MVVVSSRKDPSMVAVGGTVDGSLWRWLKDEKDEVSYQEREKRNNNHVSPLKEV